MKSIRAVFTSAEPSDQIPQRNVVVTQDRQMLIGRAPNHATKKPKAAEDNLYLISPIVSRKHATIIVSDLGSLQVTDNNSTHGTSVNGVVLKPSTKQTLHVGDILRFGIPIINGSTTHKPPEYKVLFIGPAISGPLSRPREAANVTWQFMVPESDTSCEGDNDMIAAIQAHETFSSPSVHADNTMLSEDNDIKENLLDASNSSNCSLNLTDEESRKEDVDHCTDEVRFLYTKETTGHLLNIDQDKDETDEAHDRNRSKALTSLKNILNDSSTNPSQEVAIVTSRTTSPVYNDYYSSSELVKVSNADTAGQCGISVSEISDGQSLLSSETHVRETGSFAMSDIVKVSTLPLREEGSSNSQAPNLKRKADCISTDMNEDAFEDLRKENKRLAIALAKCATGDSSEHNACFSSIKASKSTGLKLTSALVGAMLGGVGVFATLASLPDNFFQ